MTLLNELEEKARGVQPQLSHIQLLNLLSPWMRLVSQLLREFQETVGDQQEREFYLRKDLDKQKETVGELYKRVEELELRLQSLFALQEPRRVEEWRQQRSQPPYLQRVYRSHESQWPPPSDHLPVMDRVYTESLSVGIEEQEARSNTSPESSPTPSPASPPETPMRIMQVDPTMD